MPPDGRSERPERSEGRERSPEGAYTMRLTSAEGASSVLYRASEASEDGSKRPERSEGRLRSPVGAYTCIQSPVGVSERRRRERERRRRERRAPKARARRPFNIHM